MAICCSNSLGTRASSADVLMSSSRIAVVVPLDESLGKVLQFAPIWNEHMSQERSELSSAQRTPMTDSIAAPRNMVELLQRRCRSFRFLSRPRAQRDLAHSCPECCQRVRHAADDIFDLPSIQSLAEKLKTYGAIRNPMVFLSHSVNLAAYPWTLGFSKTLDLDKTLTFIRSCIWTAYRCLNCFSASPGEPAFLNLILGCESPNLFDFCWFLPAQPSLCFPFGQSRELHFACFASLRRI